MSKLDTPARGLKKLREVVGQLAIPLIAIGGITPDRVRSVIEAGASGIAVMSGIWEAVDPLEAVHAYTKALLRMEVS
ncbi:hypothetical protein FU659_27015 [Paenibacillus sp. N3.4]|nr:hypothetical protein FU659_27015 [Paenibacillus sp. N3.4]